MLISVIISTRNRRKLLERALASVAGQKFQDFECIVVDDGSEDATADFLEHYREEAGFPLVVLRQDHSGKHVALNRASEIARGELFYILDSDDELKPESLVQVSLHWAALKEREGDVAGIVGLAEDRNAQLIGSRLPLHDTIENWGKVYYEMGWKGDKVMIVRTELMRKFPFPEIAGERFLAEGIIWDKLAVYGARFGFLNVPLTVVEYQSDGLSATIDRLRAENPKGALLVYSYFLEDVVPRFNVSWWNRFRGGANFVRYGLHLKNSRAPVTPLFSRVGLLAYTTGIVLQLLDLIRLEWRLIIASG